MNTIVALATPPGNSGVAVIRISGDDSISILQKLTRSDSFFEPRKMYLKKIYLNGITDQSLVVFFQKPFSYTGEDVVEIQSHGGYFLAQKIIEECLKLGCTMATAGEYTKRAFINGKLSIDQAEGVMDLINSESMAQANASSNLMLGKLKNKIAEYQNLLTDILAEIEAKLDYPEYEFDDTETNDLKYKIDSILSELNLLIKNSDNGLKIKNGIRVAIVGAPNVGKSSLLNALTNSEKAIVTNIAGTTRDVIESEYEYGGIIFRLFDTAGIHESDDIVENIGIERAKLAIDDSDLILRISDIDNICDINCNKPHIDIMNKCDITDKRDDNFFYISAKNNENIDALKQLIFDSTIHNKIDSNTIYLTNLRQINCVKDAIASLVIAKDNFENSTMDIISYELKNAWSNLGKVTGMESDESIIDKIFSKFCLGK